MRYTNVWSYRILAVLLVLLLSTPAVSFSQNGEPPSHDGEPPIDGGDPDPTRNEIEEYRVPFCYSIDEALDKAKVKKTVGVGEEEEAVVDDEASKVVIVYFRNTAHEENFYPKVLQNEAVKSMAESGRVVFAQVDVDPFKIPDSIRHRYEISEPGNLDAWAVLDWYGNVMLLQFRHNTKWGGMERAVRDTEKIRKQYMEDVAKYLEKGLEDLEKENYTKACKHLTEWEEADGFPEASELQKALGKIETRALSEFNALQDRFENGKTKWRKMRRTFNTLAKKFPGTYVADEMHRYIWEQDIKTGVAKSKTRKYEFDM